MNILQNYICTHILLFDKKVQLISRQYYVAQRTLNDKSIFVAKQAQAKWTFQVVLKSLSNQTI